jgi:isoquinoline 1-oxidoreductase
MTSEMMIDNIFHGEEDTIDLAPLDVTLNRRAFLQALGAGLLITVAPQTVDGQPPRRGQGGNLSVAARLHINTDGTITVFTGKVEEGQGVRAELAQAAAEELHVPVDQIRMIMADTELVPDDGITAGSRSTPRTVPDVRRGAATARDLLIAMAAQQWNVSVESLTLKNGTLTHAAGTQTLTYADLARSEGLAETLKQAVREDVTLTPLGQWKVMGRSAFKPTVKDIITGRHRYPRDIQRPNMWYSKVMRPPSYGAELQSIDLSPAQAMNDVFVMREGSFVAVAAPTTFKAMQALDAISQTATWTTVSHPSSENLFTHLKETARSGRSGPQQRGNVDQALAQSDKTLNATYEIAYVQHVPMEPRSATAEWNNGKLTVWTGVDNPQRVQGNIADTCGVDPDQVRLIVPDMGCGFGGKHTGEAAEEAARLSKAAGRPIAVHWTRTEEFTWAYFRPAALIECKSGLDANGKLTAWDFTSINPGGSGIDVPYNIPNTRIHSMGADAPLRQGAYRALGSTANNFARESFIDELAATAGIDPLAFRRTHLNNPRIRVILEKVAEKFNWDARKQAVTAERGVGLACGTEKGSVVAACVEVAIDRQRGTIKLIHVCEAFECGPILNPENLESQVRGCISMGLGPALREAIEFADGKILNPEFARYRVPRFTDLPTMDIHLVENRDIPPAGAGETPLIAIAPAIGNAVFAATGVRLRSMPLKGVLLKNA